MKFNCCSSFLSVGAVVMAASSRLGVLMKLDKNQRKPRVFKASDLCPYYNRRVNSSNNSCCFHNIYKISLLYKFVLLVFVKQGDLYLCLLEDFSEHFHLFRSRDFECVLCFSKCLAFTFTHRMIWQQFNFFRSPALI